MITIEELLKLAAEVGETYTGSWGSLNQPWYDHRYDWARGPTNWMWMERGIFGMQCIQEGDQVLDLFCGDGMFSGLFFSRLAKHVDGVDRNLRAIELARRLYSRPNVTFHVLDAGKVAFPSNRYDAIMFFEGIEHLSVQGGDALLGKIAECLSESSNGTLLGSTPLEGWGNPEHDNVFGTVEELRKFLSPHFKQVDCWLSKWSPKRTEVYFKCV